MVLGEKAAEEKGKAIGMSIRSIGPEGMTAEITIATEIKGFGRYPSGRNMGTMTVLQGPKTSTGTGQGVIMTTDGESLPWHASFIGKTAGDRIRNVALVTFSTHSQKYAWMNEVLFVLDGESTADFSELSDTSYEWK
jgi:hypothetical protein